MVSRYVRPLALLAMLHAVSESQPAYAQGQALRQMDHAMWTASDGAPQAITQLVQDPDGSLWLGSESGLFNLDLLTLAKTIADRVEAAAAQAAVPVAVCVMDIHGNIALKHRMGDAPAFSIEISERKANGRPASARAAGPGSLPIDEGGWGPLLRHGRRCAG